MLSLYGAIIRSVVEYGMEAYFNPSIAHDIKKIDNEVLRLCTSALQCTPISAFQHNGSKMHVVIRHKQLCLKYRTHLLKFKNHPTNTVIQDSWYDKYSNYNNYRSFHLLTKGFFADKIFCLDSLPLAICESQWLPPGLLNRDKTKV